jgi:hypothetical protein
LDLLTQRLLSSKPRAPQSALGFGSGWNPISRPRAPVALCSAIPRGGVSKILPARSAECTPMPEYASEFDLICASATHFYTGASFVRAVPRLASAGSGTLRLRTLDVAEAACADFRYSWKSRSLPNTYFSNFNTGHTDSVATIHANSATKALRR